MNRMAKVMASTQPFILTQHSKVLERIFGCDFLRSLKDEVDGAYNYRTVIKLKPALDL